MNLTMTDFGVEFDGIFITELQHAIERAVTLLGEHETKSYTEYILQVASNGKRIRPYNAALTYIIYSGKDWRDIKHTLVGIELIHLMAIIQDDVMDNSETRHGVATMHSFIQKDLSHKVSPDKADHTSRSIAILMGDLAFSWAYANFSKDNQTPQSWNMIHSLMEEVILGQMMDVYNPIETQNTAEKNERKMLLKTARYTFTRPLLIGATCAGANGEEASWITRFGDAVGLLFQMQDDIFDITKDAITLKKDPLGDMQNGIYTLLSVYIMEHATKEEQARWSSWFGNKNTNNQDEIKLFIASTGALAFAEEFIHQQEKNALEALAQSELTQEDKEKFISLLSAITKRKY